MLSGAWQRIFRRFIHGVRKNRDAGPRASVLSERLARMVIACLHQQCDANRTNCDVANDGERKQPTARGPSEGGDERKYEADTTDTKTDELCKETREALVGKRNDDIGRRFDYKKLCVNDAEQKP
jgi:hypothetical protein